MTTYVDDSYFKELEKIDPDKICQNKNCQYNKDTKTYSIDIWGYQCQITWYNKTITAIDQHGATPHDYFYLFIIYYLLIEKTVTIQNQWISEKDLPGGPTFFRGPHLLPTEHISDKFQNNLTLFEQRCLTLGGKKKEMGDAAYQFKITKDIPITLIYWIGDEAFPPEAKILYDRSIEKLCSLDIVFALAVEVCTRVGC